MSETPDAKNKGLLHREADSRDWVTTYVLQILGQPWLTFAILFFTSLGCEDTSRPSPKADSRNKKHQDNFVGIEGHLSLEINGKEHQWQMGYDFDEAKWHQIEYLPNESVKR